MFYGPYYNYNLTFLLSLSDKLHANVTFLAYCWKKTDNDTTEER